MHIPWPDRLDVLPPSWREAIHDGLLANDVVGFHTAALGGNFRVRGCGGETGRTLVTHHPISVDVGRVRRAERQRRRARGASARSSPARPEKLIVRVDRTDPSKNIVRGFKAFGLLLDEHRSGTGG